MDQAVVDRFLDLVRRVYEGQTARSEDDLTARMTRVFEAAGLHTVVNSRVTAGSLKRPDILGYASEQNAHLVVQADLVVESKKPEEVAGFASLTEAMVSDRYWPEKTYPYLRDNISRVRYFAFTTFTEFSVFAVTREIRDALVADFATGDGSCTGLRDRIRREARTFRLFQVTQRGPGTARGWVDWVGEHLTPESLAPLPLSAVRNAVAVRDADDLEALAARLARFAAGSGDPAASDSGLFQSARNRLRGSYSSLPADVRRDLMVFTMSQNPSLDVGQAQALVQDTLRRSLDDFVASSIHSLLSRLFALKIIEDCYCIEAQPPLIEPARWIFATDAYDTLDPEQIRTEVFQRIRSLRGSTNPFVRGFAEYGFFFDWIEEYVDPVLFRSLFETFASHDFARFEGDLLGRFYELYAQQINKTRRRELGQYYTPLAIVQFMWRKALDLVRERGRADGLMVLDPAMGSATFLAEGARFLDQAGTPRFWERLTGFDISPQVLGIAHVNVYMAVLSRLDPRRAREVSGLRLYVTDALDRGQGGHLEEILSVLLDPAHRAFLEQRVAINNEAKREKSYRLVIGNPPYKNNSQLTLSNVAQRFPNLLASSVEQGGAQRRNIRDDYAWFVGVADYYIEDEGVVCYILSDSFATHQSYEHFRAEVLKNYHVRTLVRLGTNIFPDVGYRTSFAVILLEKRADRLENPDGVEEIPYTDLRPLIADTPSGDLCSPQDPRLLLLRRISRGEAELPITAFHAPAPESRYSFYPAGNAAARFHGPNTSPLHERGHDRVFAQKWPGIITAFDPLFSGDTRDVLERRFASLFEISRTYEHEAVERGQGLDSWGRQLGLNEPELFRLRSIGSQIAEAPRGTLEYDPAKVKRTFSGSMAEGTRWYPPARNTHFLYYEPQLEVARNVNEGRDPGWGTMNQWRHVLSHRISPKLIFTTASRPRYGFAAFVVDDEWYVKLHGGTSQQFNYTGLEFGGSTGRADGLPNNLADAGLELYLSLLDAGAPPDAILFYIAAIWNSDLAAELLDTGTASRPRIKIPTRDIERRISLEMAMRARTARDIARLLHHLPADQAEVSADQLEPWVDAGLLASLGFVRFTEERQRFRAREYYRIPAGAITSATGQLAAIEQEINGLVETLYS